MEHLQIGKQKIRIKQTELGEYLCITDLAKLIHSNTGQVINNWVKSIRALEYMNAWESKHNKKYDKEAFTKIRVKAGTSSFFLSSGQWIKKTNATGLKSIRGKYGGTYAHHLIALEFCATLSADFRLNVFTEYLELKQNQAALWLKTNEFFLEKMEDNAIELNQYISDFKAQLKNIDE